MPKSICVYMQIVYICDYMCGYLYIIHMIQRRSRDSDGSPFPAPHRSVSPSSTCASGPVRLTRPRGRKCVDACGYDAKLEMFTQSPVRMATRMGIVGLFSTRSDKRTYRKWDINQLYRLQKHMVLRSQLGTLWGQCPNVSNAQAQYPTVAMSLPDILVQASNICELSQKHNLNS